MPGNEGIVETYERRGCVIVRNVLDADTMRDIAGHVQWHLGRSRPGTELVQFARNADDPFWYRIVSDDRLLDIAQEFLGPDIAVFASAYFAKAAGGGKPVPWHQDSDFWPLEPMTAVSIWLAVDQSVPENGAMRVIAGSHREGLIEHEAVKGSTLNAGIPDDRIDASRAEFVVLDPGDVSIHHPHTLHGSLANNSPMRRCGLVIRYIATSTRICVDDPSIARALDGEGRWPVAFRLRGGSDHDVNAYVPPPAFVPGRHYQPER